MADFKGRGFIIPLLIGEIEDMQYRKRIWIEILSMVLVVALAGLLLGKDKIWRFSENNDNLSSVASSDSRDDNQATDRKLFKVPIIELEEEDLSGLDDRTMNENPFERARLETLSELIDEDSLWIGPSGMASYPPRPILNKFFQRRYDEIIAESKRRIKSLSDELAASDDSQNSPFHARNSSVFAEYRDNLHICAQALELSGDLEGARNLYRGIYSPSQNNLAWAFIRIDYAEFFSREDYDLVMYSFELEKICRLAMKTISSSELEDLLASLNERDASTPFSPEFDPLYSQVTAAYRLRNNCAKIVNPGLRYLANGSPNSLILLTRKSYSEFLKKMEEVRALAKEHEEYAGIVKNIEKGMSVLRLLNELPD